MKEGRKSGAIAPLFLYYGIGNSDRIPYSIKNIIALRRREIKMEERKKTKEMDMLNGGLSGKLILFAIPLAFSGILQQLFNSADVAVVGRFAGSAALAAVGSCVALVGIFVNLIPMLRWRI